ncbi:hypothetical protein [Halalkalicoccus salilacus]
MADRLGENTRTRTIDESCAFTLAMLDNLEAAIDRPRSWPRCSRPTPPGSPTR